MRQEQDQHPDNRPFGWEEIKYSGKEEEAVKQKAEEEADFGPEEEDEAASDGAGAHSSLKGLRAPFEAVREKIEAWKQIGASKVVVQAIQKGVHLHFQEKPAPQTREHKDQRKQEVRAAIQELEEAGVLQRLTKEEIQRTRTWTPIHAIPKKDSTSWRLITDLRHLNRYITTPKFRQQGWQDVLRLTQDPECVFGITIDMRSWFHHLSLNRASTRCTLSAGRSTCLHMLLVSAQMSSSHSSSV